MSIYTSNIAITWPGATDVVGLANGFRATSDPIDNTVLQFDKADVELKVMLGVGVVASGTFTVGYFTSSDGGVTYNTFMEALVNVSGFMTDGNSRTTAVHIPSVPAFWKLAVLNNTGAAFNAVGANFSSLYTGIHDEESAALSTSQVTVTVAATLLAPAIKNRQGLMIANTGGQTIYLGGSGVTTVTGYPLAMATEITLEDFKDNALYGIVAAATCTSAVMQW
jgi:hypothetical protein